MSLLEKALVFVLIGLATCNPLDFGGQQSAQTSQDAQMEKALEQVQSVIQSVQVKCKEVGKENIGDGLENRMKEAFSCIQNKVNPQELQQEFMTAAKYGTINDVFRKMCNLWPQVHTCLNQLISDSKQCLDKESQHTVDQTMGLLDDSNTFFCENDQKRMIDFLQQGGPQCLQAVGKEIGNCAQPILQKRAGKDEQKLTYDKEDCSDFHEIRACVRTQTYTCQTQVPGEIVDDYLALVQRVVCNSASSLTWFSTFNIMLVLCTYLYSKLF